MTKRKPANMPTNYESFAVVVRARSRITGDRQALEESEAEENRPATADTLDSVSGGAPVRIAEMPARRGVHLYASAAPEQKKVLRGHARTLAEQCVKFLKGAIVRFRSEPDDCG